MYGYIYLTTNNINGKKYVGKHRAEFFDKCYKGSGKYLKRAFDKYGIENFSCDILKECNSLEELNQSEIEFIKLFNAVESREFYNLARGGEGHTAKFSEESKIKSSLSHKGYIPTDEARKNMREAALKRKPRTFKHKTPMTEEHKRKIVEARRASGGYIVSDETKEKMRQAHKNQIPWNKGLKYNEVC